MASFCEAWSLLLALASLLAARCSLLTAASSTRLSILRSLNPQALPVPALPSPTLPESCDRQHLACSDLDCCSSCKHTGARFALLLGPPPAPSFGLLVLPLFSTAHAACRKLDCLTFPSVRRPDLSLLRAISNTFRPSPQLFAYELPAPDLKLDSPPQALSARHRLVRRVCSTSVGPTLHFVSTAFIEHTKWRQRPSCAFRAHTAPDAQQLSSMGT